MRLEIVKVVDGLLPSIDLPWLEHQSIEEAAAYLRNTLPGFFVYEQPGHIAVHENEGENPRLLLLKVAD